MGCLESKAVRQAKKKTAEIDREMMRLSGIDSKTIKLLLLGAGESGKSTILKQMKILHDNGFTKEEVSQLRAVVYNNTVSSMASILRAMNDFSIKFDHPAREDDGRLIYEVMGEGDESEPLTPELANAIKQLWADSGIQEMYERRSEYQLNDSAKYFFDAIDRISQPGYTPSQDDMLHTRVKTCGIVEIQFALKGMDFRVCDVGGQRSERKKWIHCFEGVNAVIFITALSEYDQVLFEDETTNRMQESVGLFDSICNSKWFAKSSMIVFFNKKDLFAEKINKQVSLSIAFPDYEGPIEYDICAKYIEAKFKEVRQEFTKTVYCHQTCATDTNQVQLVLSSCIDMIVSQNLKGSGLF